MARSQRSKRGRKNRAILRSNIYQKHHRERNRQVYAGVPLEKRGTVAARIPETAEEKRDLDTHIMGDDWTKLVAAPMKRSGFSWKKFVVKMEGPKKPTKRRDGLPFTEEEK